MLSATQLRLLTAFKTALAVVIALGIAMKLNWERPYWTGITVFITFLPYVGAAFEKSVLRLAGTLAAGVLAYLLTGWFEQDQFLMSVSLFVILGLLAYGAVGNKFPYFFILCGITLCIIVGTTIVEPTELWHLVLYRTLEVALGIVVALSVNNLIFPQRASNALRYKVADTLRDCNGLLSIASKHYQENAPLPGDADKRVKVIAAQFPGIIALTQSALRDSSRFHHHGQVVEEIIREIRSSFVAISTTLRAASSDSPKQFQKELETELRTYIEALQSDISQLIEDLQRDTAARRLEKSHEAREVLRTKVQLLRAEGVSMRYPVDDATNFYAYLGDIDSLHESLIRLAQADRTLYSKESPSKLPKRVHEKKKHGQLDRLRLHHGIKVGIASLIALYAYLWLQWPSGVTAFLTCAIVMQVSHSASNQKSMLRLGGCLLGGIFGALTLAVVEPNFSSYYGYCIPLFFIFAFFSWINNGSVKYAYAGFQAQLAFLLMTTISAQQSADIAAGVDRFLGILLGVFIAALVQRLIWPVLPEREFCNELGRFFERSEDFMRQQDKRIVIQQSTPAERTQEVDLASIESLPQKTLDWLGQISFYDREEKDKAALTQLYLNVQTISFALRGMAQANARILHKDTLDKMHNELRALDHALADAMQRCGRSIAQNKAIGGESKLKQSLNELEKRLTQLLRVEHATQTLNNQELSCFLALVRRYRELTSLMINCESEINKLNFKVLERSAFF